jgi:hypothetical protein
MIEDHSNDNDDEEGEIYATGSCPYCGVIGRIAGESSWCPHYMGTFDYFSSSEPDDRLFCDEYPDVCRYRGFLDSLAGLTPKKALKSIAPMPAWARKFVEKSWERQAHLFWLDLVPRKTLEVDVSEFLCDTTYISVFVKNPDRQRLRIVNKIARALSALENCPTTRSLLPGKPGS